MKKIKYIAFYDIDNDEENRNSSIAAVNKINYISKSLVKNGYSVEIISPSWTNNSTGFYHSNEKKIFENVLLITFATFGGSNKFMRILKYLFSLSQLFLYLIFKTHMNEEIIVYHSVILYFPIRWAQAIKKFRVILEVEEVYQDAQELSTFMKKTEKKAFEKANKFLLSTVSLDSKINLINKPSLVINGTYQVEEERNKKITEEKIHIVYAGTFDTRKGGAFAAVAAGEFLSSNYHMHIIGFGTERDKKKLIKKIKEVSEKTTAKITYDGYLTGEEFISFIQQCHIGLSTQVPNAEYNDTSFPSKILSYLANGLRVVSAKIKVVENSAIGEEIYYYRKQEPKLIAEAIMSIDIEQYYDSRKMIQELDKEFRANLKKILEK